MGTGSAPDRPISSLHRLTSRGSGRQFYGFKLMTLMYCTILVLFITALVYLYRGIHQQKLLDIPHINVRSRPSVTRTTFQISDSLVSEREADQQEDSAIKVIIISYMRSGTTLLGKLFDENDEAFYIFEPMWYMCVIAVPGFKQLSFLNGSKCFPPQNCNSIGLRETEYFLNCRIDEITTVFRKFWMQTARKTNKFYRCGLESECIEDFTRDCKRSPLRAAKVINLRIDDVRPLLEKYPNLRILHLVRDPRGVIQSRIPMKEYYYHSPVITGANLCGDMARDIRSFRKLSALFPDRLLQIRYEDFAESPVKHTRNIYDFLNTPLPDRVEKFVQENTHAREQDSWSLGTARLNSALTSYKWRHKIAWDLALAMDSTCSRVYKGLGYVKAGSEKMLRNLTIPLKLPKEDEFDW